MKFKTGAIGFAAALFLVSSAYADQGVSQPEGGIKQSESSQGDLGGSNPPGADVGAGGQGSNSQNGSGLNGSGQTDGNGRQGDMGGGSQGSMESGNGSSGSTPQGSDLGGTSQGGAMQNPASGNDPSGQNSAMQGDPSSTGKKETGWPSVAGVQQIQQKLNEQGYKVGSVDGKFGPKTKEALRKFQETKGIKPTGQPDKQTMAALGVQNDAMQGGSSQGSSSQPGDMGGGAPNGGSQSTTPQGAGGSQPGIGDQQNRGIQGSDQQAFPGSSDSSRSDGQIPGNDPQNSEAGARQK